MVRLYHGTCASKLPSIQTHGLRPPVYLTTDPKTAALVAADPDWCKEGDPMILSIDLSEKEVKALQPDMTMLRLPMYHGILDDKEWIRLLRLGESEMSGIETLRAVGSAIYPKTIRGDRLDIYPLESDRAIRWAWGRFRRSGSVRVRSYRRRSR